jgi:hypothetical protein
VAPNGEAIPFNQRLAMAAVAGGCGGLVGTPGGIFIYIYIYIVLFFLRGSTAQKYIFCLKAFFLIHLLP